MNETHTPPQGDTNGGKPGEGAAGGRGRRAGRVRPDGGRVLEQRRPLLVERVARLDIQDTIYHGTPLGWARYGGQTEIEKYLRAHGAKFADEVGP